MSSYVNPVCWPLFINALERKMVVAFEQKHRENVVDEAVRRVDVPVYWRDWAETAILRHGGVLSDECVDCRKHAYLIRAEYRRVAEAAG